MRHLTYLNLSLGLCMTSVTDYPAEVRFCRLQSSHLEAGRFDLFLESVPDDLLAHYILGGPILIVDGSHHPERSQLRTKGIPLLNYTLQRYVLKTDPHDIRISSLGPQVLKEFMNLKTYQEFYDKHVTSSVGNKVRDKLRYYQRRAEQLRERGLEVNHNPIELHVLPTKDTEEYQKLLFEVFKRHFEEIYKNPFHRVPQVQS